MLIIIGEAEAASGRRDEMLEAVAAMAAATQSDDGCDLYGFYVDVSRPDVDPQCGAVARPSRARCPHGPPAHPGVPGHRPVAGCWRAGCGSSRVSPGQDEADEPGTRPGPRRRHRRRPGRDGRRAVVAPGRPPGRPHRAVPGSSPGWQHPQPVAAADQGARTHGGGHRRPRRTVPVRVPQLRAGARGGPASAGGRRRYGGGFIGLLRPELYQRLLAALPPGTLQVDTEVTSFDQDEDGVTLTFADGTTEQFDVLVGADGIDSLVRRTLWGDAPKREHNLHIFGGFTFDDDPGRRTGRCVVSHNRTTQGSWTAIRHKGRSGYQWWVLTAHDAAEDFAGDYHQAATALAAPFADPLPRLVAATARRRPAVGHPRPEAAQAVVEGAGHADRRRRASHVAVRGVRGRHGHRGRLLPRSSPGRARSDGPCGGVTRALLDFEAPRRPHTARQSQTAYKLGSAVSPLTTSPWHRSVTPSSITPRSCRRSSASPPPVRSSSSSTRSTSWRRGSFPPWVEALHATWEHGSQNARLLSESRCVGGSSAKPCGGVGRLDVALWVKWE